MRKRDADEAKSGVACVMAVVYGALLMRGPIESDFAAYQRAQGTA